MNALVPQYHANLPDFLRDPNLFGLSDQVSAGIGGGQPPYISIKGSRFSLVNEAGEAETVNQLHLDVFILHANRNVSKIYYEGAYDPAAGNSVPPTCWSDNGIAPSSRAQAPQSPTCAACPHNAWGSKVTPSGSQIKACSDAKKLAVILADNVPTLKGGLGGQAAAGAQVYLLRVPAASMRGVADVSKMVQARGVPLLGCTIRLGFDGQASYPALTFTPQGFASREFFLQRVLPLSQSAEVIEIVGGTDTPKGQPGALPLGSGAVGPQESRVVPLAQTPPSGSGSGPAPASPAAAPASSAPATPATPTPSAASATSARKRGRPAGVPPANGTSSPEPLAAASPTPGPFDDRPGQPPIQPVTPTSPQMDALLDGIFAKTAG